MKRSYFSQQLSHYLSNYSVVAMLGPRQCGKTTLARMYVEHSAEPLHYFDLEDPVSFAQLQNPKLSLEPLQGLIVIDEIQRQPDL